MDKVLEYNFQKVLREVGELEFFERGVQYLGCNTRRVDDHVWIRVNELILPNFTQAGSAFATDGTKTRYFGRSSFTRWVVPIDDNHCIAVAWGNFGERGDPMPNIIPKKDVKELSLVKLWIDHGRKNKKDLEMQRQLRE